MDLSRTTKDPLRHLKRLRTSRTPAKTESRSHQSSQFSQSNMTIMDNHECDSRLEQTALLKENCYDGNRYYSAACQEYLRKVGFGESGKRRGPRGGRRDRSKDRSPVALRLTSEDVYGQSKQRSRTVESEDSLKETLLSIEKEHRNVCSEEAQAMTFKKLTFTAQSGSEESKRNAIVQRQLEFDLEPSPFQAEAPQKQMSLKVCESCKRKFNEDSYAKHVRICERVFVKKRRQFSSERQRSRSKDSKKK